MKLYTEEQAKYFYDCGRNFQINGELEFDIVKQFVTPIELPSDEEDKEKYKYTEEDIRSAIIFGYNKRTFDLDKIGILDENSFIQSLSQPKKKNNNEPTE